MPAALRTAALLTVFAGLVAGTPAQARVLRDLDFQAPKLLRADGRPTQWDGYVPGGAGTSGIVLGSPGSLPFPYTQAARFVPPDPTGRPRSMAKLRRDARADPGVKLQGPVDAAEALQRYYRWWTLFPRSFDLPDKPLNAPAVFHAWHNDSSQSGCNTNIQMHVKRRWPGANGLRYLIRVQGGLHSQTVPTWFAAEGGTNASCYTETFKEIDLGEMHPGRWTLWKIHIKWSSRPGNGLIEIERDGRLTRIEGANLYRSPAGNSETGYMHHGFYSPVDRSEEARRRSVWQVGMRVGDAPRDMGPPPGCRALRAPAQRLRAGGRTLTFDVGSAASTDHPAVVSMTGGRSRRAYVVAGGKRHRFRKGRARVPAAAFPIGKAKGLAVRLGGHRVTLRVRADGCL